MFMEHRRKLRHAEKKTCHSATWSTTNRMWTGLNLNPDLRGDRLATSLPDSWRRPHVLRNETILVNFIFRRFRVVFLKVKKK